MSYDACLPLPQTRHRSPEGETRPQQDRGHGATVEINRERLIEVEGDIPTRFQAIAEILDYVALSSGSVAVRASRPGIHTANVDRTIELSGPRDVLVRGVEQALLNDEYSFRTVPGLADELSISEEDVRLALSALSSRVRQPLAPDGSGRELYTHSSRSASLKERLLSLRSSLAIW